MKIMKHRENMKHYETSMKRDETSKFAFRFWHELSQCRLSRHFLVRQNSDGGQNLVKQLLLLWLPPCAL